MSIIILRGRERETRALRSSWDKDGCVCIETFLRLNRTRSEIYREDSEIASTKT